MSKKPQKPQSQNNPKKSQIVDQQNQPFLRTIAKRIRNINKKLTQIDELKKKGDLKPEQIEKVNRKIEYEQQKSKLEGIADFYREAYAENFQQYRSIQLQELDSLANAISILRSSAHFKDADKLADLNKALTESSTVSLIENAKNISESLRRYANDLKLKKSVDAFLAENPVSHQPEQKEAQHPAQQERVQEVKIEELKQEVQKPIVQQVLIAGQSPQQEALVQEPTHPSQSVSQEVPIEQKSAENQPLEQTTTEGGDKRPHRENNRTRGQYRGPRENRGPRDNRGPREYKRPREPREQGKQEEVERRRYNPNRQRLNYKPKNQEEESDSDSSLERVPAMRNFKKEEIRKLVDDGFQVVGKPKPKAKEGQKEWYEKTHGKKSYHHQHQQK